jgi:hypothetical protein
VCRWVEYEDVSRGMAEPQGDAICLPVPSVLGHGFRQDGPTPRGCWTD